MNIIAISNIKHPTEFIWLISFRLYQGYDLKTVTLAKKYIENKIRGKVDPINKILLIMESIIIIITAVMASQSYWASILGSQF